VKFLVLSNKKHFNFNLLRNSFQTALLRELFYGHASCKNLLPGELSYKIKKAGALSGAHRLLP